MDEILHNNDNSVVVSNFRNASGVINNATISADLMDLLGVVISTVSVASTGSGGNYRGTFSKAVCGALTVGAFYRVKIYSSNYGIVIYETYRCTERTA